MTKLNKLSDNYYESEDERVTVSKDTPSEILPVETWTVTFHADTLDEALRIAEDRIFDDEKYQSETELREEIQFQLIRNTALRVQNRERLEFLQKIQNEIANELMKRD